MIATAHPQGKIWSGIKSFFAPAKTKGQGAAKKRKRRPRKTTTFFEMP